MLIATLVMVIGAHDAPPGPPVTEVAAMPTGTDALYLQPVDGLTAPVLIDALTRLGYAGGEEAHEGVRIRLTARDDPATLIRALAATGLLRSIEGDAVLTAARTPADPLFEDRQQAYLEAIRAPEAWDTTVGDDSVVIAVIDTGVDWNHPDLVDRILINEDEDFLSGRDDDRNGCVDDIAGCNFVTLSTADPSCGYVQAPPNWRAIDDEGHGTFVSGIAAGTGDNSLGIAGIAWRARILPVKVLDCTATGRISDAVAGIRYAARMGADVINISFGTPNDSPALREAVVFAQEQGSVVVASAGNDGRSGVTFPARYPGVLSVAASGAFIGSADEDEFDPALVDYTTTAEFARFGEPVDFLAPGVGIISTVPPAMCEQGFWNCVEEGPYAVGSGSSYATPMVAGAVALVVATYPERSADFAAGLLLSSRTFRPGEPGGLLDIAAAVTREIFTGGVPGTARTGTVPREGSQPDLHPRD